MADSQTFSSTFQADIIIYGGTSSAVIAACTAAKMGKSVIVVSPDKHLGGLSSSGLGFTDTGNTNAIGGLAREFYHRIYLHYQREEAWNWQKRSEYGDRGQGNPAIDKEKRTMWIFEPHVAEKVFNQLIKEYNIQVYKDEWLDREKGVVKVDGKIQSIQTLNKKVFQGKVFIDATYEGDLMAAAKVKYHIGREAGDVYNEEWNGVQTGVFHHDSVHQFQIDISPYVVPGDPSSGIVPRVSPNPPGQKRQGDSKIQAYCFRMCMTQHQGNKVPISRPEGYDEKQYELLARLFEAGWNDFFFKFDPIPNWKTDVNNHGPFSFDNIGMNYDYPEASYARRREIIEEHETYQKGLLYFVATSPRVPASIQQELNRWGYAKDEFVDNGHWPYNLYVREARRMIGEFVMTEHEVLGKRSVPESIGMGSYVLDSHNVQRYIKADGFVQNEGDIGVHPPKPYQIALGTILPKKRECKNLLVPVAASCSHIAFGSIRMEPVFMVLGQSAATVAGLALEKAKDIHEVPYAEIKNRLVVDGQVLEVALDTV